MKLNDKTLSYYSLLNWTGIAIVSSAWGIVMYLQYYHAFQTCLFCIASRSLLLLLGGLYLYQFFVMRMTLTINIIQLFFSFLGTLLSLRQLFFQHGLLNPGFYQTPELSQLKAIVHWFFSGAYSCPMTPTIGALTLASWALITFSLLCLLTAIQFYLHQNGPV